MHYALSPMFIATKGGPFLMIERQVTFHAIPGKEEDFENLFKILSLKIKHSIEKVRFNFMK